ncbi:glycosyltransferase [Rhizomonospora bruguierae]|uniref:glycosyltransferase n=1 Tax=Rhizomonospora bruguierae TaxID=1581705 RepID=UPI001BCB98C0|nr:glycosyltransferase [Micromonospora sp. NBRC 107566]
MNILLWHVHGSWTTAFVQGKHRYLVPVTPDRGPYGLGRARTYPWPETVVEVTPGGLANADIDLVILQRPEEEDLVHAWTGRTFPTVYVEHNTPKGAVPETRHPMANRDDVLLVHVTDFNALMWNAGGTRTAVVDHGICPPAASWTGDLHRLGMAANEPVRRLRVLGADLLPRFAAVAPVDVYGLGVTGLPGRLGLPPERLAVYDDPTQAQMHAQLARRRLYLHLPRWTSLGLSLIEAMAMGMPVVGLATTEAVVAVPPDAGVLATKVDTLVEAAEWLLHDEAAARRLGARARRVARGRYGLDRFLADWDRIVEEERCASR